MSSTPRQIFLSWGMGAESTALLVNWIVNPRSRNFPLSALTVITAQTGNEWRNTKTLCERYILPLLRQHRIRLVQVARAGQFERDGTEVLNDSDQPDEIYIDGAYRLSDELQFAGTVPLFAGVHTCALKFKAFVLERWLQEENPQGQISQAFGFNSMEQRRVAKSEYSIAKRIAFGFSRDEGRRIDRANEYDPISRDSFYPLVEWNWTREHCLDFLREQFDITWPKSCCVWCPFVSFKDNSLERFRQFPEEAAEALLIEYTSLCMNHRGTLYKNRSLFSILRDAAVTEAIDSFYRLRLQTPTATYRVRRIMTSKGHGYRCTQVVNGTLPALISEQQLIPRTFHHDEYAIETGYVCDRGDTFPTREEFYVSAPTTIAARARYGIPWFDQKWAALDQIALFN